MAMQTPMRWSPPACLMMGKKRTSGQLSGKPTAFGEAALAIAHFNCHDLSVKQALPAMHATFCIKAMSQQLDTLNADLLEKFVEQYAGGGMHGCLPSEPRTSVYPCS